ncbi:FecCD family ABC transporter permease [Brevibacillus choshinensis]|uniref:FecCD family ABC transporter permease n=1 Tax=Brevibacillus choshinensis TaxID=54911 RepID=UPI002E1E44AD|nr:iron chelate uptake ABC transporter family permease subunit [Brevibacillus choshinensis]MED4779293.1 iron chelate uptake ABC transporter family permease subunit [Brevibacillus choshinensis]
MRGGLSLLILGLIMALLLSITLAITLGSVEIHPGTVWGIALAHVPIFGEWVAVDWTRAQQTIIWDIRFPRVLLAAVVGAGLSVVGVAIQSLVRNSLADPYILGVSSGASVGATLVILFGAFSIYGQYALSMGAFLGSLLSILLIFSLSRMGGQISTVRLLLAGIAISAILSAVTSLIIFSAPNEHGIQTVLFWMSGSLAGAKWEYLTIPSLVVIACLLVLLAQYRSLNAMLMGEESASTLGVNTTQFRKLLLVITALLTGVIVAISGAIGFVGLMMPHIVRVIVGSDHRRVLPVSALLGAIFLIWADALARLSFAPEELPIGIITALCGGPFFIWLMLRSSYSFGRGGR